MLLLWWVASDTSWLAERILPSPVFVYGTARDMVLSGELFYHAGIRLRRVVIGLALGATAGLTLGIAMGLSQRNEDYVKPLFLAFAQIPTLGWIPLLMLLVGMIVIGVIGFLMDKGLDRTERLTQRWKRAEI